MAFRILGWIVVGSLVLLTSAHPSSADPVCPLAPLDTSSCVSSEGSEPDPGMAFRIVTDAVACASDALFAAQPLCIDVPSGQASRPSGVLTFTDEPCSGVSTKSAVIDTSVTKVAVSLTWKHHCSNGHVRLVQGSASCTITGGTAGGNWVWGPCPFTYSTNAQQTPYPIGLDGTFTHHHFNGVDEATHTESILIEGYNDGSVACTIITQPNPHTNVLIITKC